MLSNTTLICFVNGKRVEAKNVDPETTLLRFLREELRLTGAKLGCGEGGCGACTVMVSRYDRKKKKIVHFTLNSCLTPACAMHGMAITTVEGIGSTRTKLHPVQESLSNSHGSQCGFCTPGIIMSMYALLRNNPSPRALDVEDAFQGNLCRCTGYRPILQGFQKFTKDFKCPMGENCCKNTNNEVSETPVKIPRNTNGEECSTSDYLPYDPSQEPIFPSELQLSDILDKSSLHFHGERSEWFRPTTLQELLHLKEQYPNARLIIGNTEVALEIKLKRMHYPVMIGVTHIDELNRVEHGDDGIYFGGSVSLTTLNEEMEQAVSELPGFKTRMFSAIIEMLRWFAGPQIRNVAAIAGNIMTSSPISDLNPLFLAAKCELTLQSKERGLRKLKIDEKFFLGYRKTAVLPDEVLISICIPYTTEDIYFEGFKQANRREDDISIVNGGFQVEFEKNSIRVKDICLAFGGMAPTTVLAKDCMKGLIGSDWDEKLLDKACQLLAKDLQMPPGTPGGQESYRRSLAASFFFKFYLSIRKQLHQMTPDLIDTPVPDNFTSATQCYTHKVSHGSQIYQEVKTGQPLEDAVGRAVIHRSADKQTTGEAKYCPDVPKTEGELYLGLVLSSKAHAKIRNIDASKALQMPGVVGLISADDIPNNQVGAIFPCETVFASEEVVAQGQIIAGILADTQMHAQRATQAVSIDYDVLPHIITIEEAIEASSFYGDPLHMFNCDSKKELETCDKVIEGEIHIGGQEHFYLETQGTIAIPRGEDGEMELISSTQNPSWCQNRVASMLNVPANRITCRVKRIGGGFGGKENRMMHPLMQVAAAAYKFQKPVRCILDRDEDMQISGTRHPFLGKYKVGVKKNGKIEVLDITLYANAGYSEDLSRPVTERALISACNAYGIPKMNIRGFVCKTNIPSNTAFRGFGGPQAMFMCESLICHVAETLNIPAQQVREMNLQYEGYKNVLSQKLENVQIEKCWKEVIQMSQIEERKSQVELFNKENRWRKRGIEIIPTTYGIGFMTKFMNQAGALVHIYQDGSVLLAHGGVEIGQGLHTKMIQIASRVLGIPINKIHISETSTMTVPNTSPTAASSGSDLNGVAVMNACKTLSERLAHLKKNKPDLTWEELIMEAYCNQISLSATGYYGVDYVDNINYETQSGPNALNYFVFGAACSEVEIDCLTGDHKVLRTDIVMDLGESLNPAIDVGQIEGGFVQGYGLFTMEQQKFSPDGYLFNRGPGAYKIPGFGDIPTEFNVALLKGSSNPRAIYSSKAVGEPPLFLAASVFFAIRNAIRAARLEEGLTGYFRLDSPATSEAIRMACVDRFTKQFPDPEPGTFRPWYVKL